MALVFITYSDNSVYIYNLLKTTASKRYGDKCLLYIYNLQRKIAFIGHCIIALKLFLQPTKESYSFCRSW